VARGGGENRTINRRQKRTSGLAAQNIKLVPQHHQLEILHVGAATTANDQPEQKPKTEIDK
jgi:hypothetical protein